MLYRSATMMAIALMTVLPASAQPSSDSWADPRPLSVKLSSFKYDPSTITLQHGVVYDLRLENLSSHGHDFQAKAFFAAAKIMPSDSAKVANGRIKLGGKESVDVTLVAPSAGTYEVRCTHFMHSAFGMTGRIVVQ